MTTMSEQADTLTQSELFAPHVLSPSIFFLPAWTETRRDIASAILTRLRAQSLARGEIVTETLPDGAILTVHVRADGGEFYSTVGGSKFRTPLGGVIDPHFGKRWRCEAWNFGSGIAIVRPHLNDVCSECYGLGGDVRLVAGEWADCDCPACDGTGALRGSASYNARMARIEAMRRRAAQVDLPV